MEIYGDNNSKVRTEGMIDYVSEACGCLLPCGMCRITMQQCPKMPCKVEPTWITTTAGTGMITVNAKGEIQND